MKNNRLLADAVAAASEDCGCAPTPAESRAFWSSSVLTRRNAFGLGALGVVALSAFGISSGISTAHAATYPNWDDVQRAMNNESAKAGEIVRIEGLIQSLQQNVAATQAAAEVASNEFYAAQQQFFDAVAEADLLQAQADTQAGIADAAAGKAAQAATQLYRNGGDDTSLELFFAGSAANADELLSRLGTMDKLLQFNQSVYDTALAARDSAQLLTDQAIVAREERDRLQQVAEEKMVLAQEAADAAQAALEEQANNLFTLQAQLEALKSQTAYTVEQYQVGVEIERQRREEAERQRKAAEEAERRRLEEAERIRREQEAANNNSGGGGAPSSGGGGGGGGNSGGGGSGGSGGWVRPHGGHRSSGYGPRSQQCGSNGCSSSWHHGVDLANGCGAPIYAAQSGTVTAAFYNGGYGNYVRIDHGGGVATGYAHIIRNGYAVRHGQWVNAGQIIAYAGNTGGSFGCHLHFEVYINGRTVNPIDYMANRGIWV